MIYDANLLFSNAQNVFSAGSTVTSTNVIDLLRLGQDPGVGDDLYIMITVTTAFAGGTSVAFNLVTDDNAGMASVALVATLVSLTIAQLALNTEWPIRFPIVQAVPMERYLAINYVSTGTTTAGAVTAGIVHDVQRTKAYPSNFVSA
jgi:hypothetical protein